MAPQALYRRYRPSCFAELRGQEPVVRALQNAVRHDRVGHAYLFSGPRGTGKTSTARILAKALNCTDLSGDGEPCGKCQSCLEIANNTSYDLIELDAASNNKVDDVRELISRVAIGSPGKAKVYVLDEVHMLTSGAENALLKTLEEPPDHVVFVLCTTEPHKVVPTIRSRTQHLEFSLIDGDVLADHARWVVEQAGLEIDADAIDHAVHRGAGSARDTLSALDQIAAAGGVAENLDAVDAIVDALAEQEHAAAFASVHEALRSGREPRVIGEALLDRLRNAFLGSMGADLSYLTDAQQRSAQATGAKIPPARLTRSLEVLGTALVEMRQAPDPRVDLEVALGRLIRRELDTDISALLERIERLEFGGPPTQGGPGSAGAPAPAAAPVPSQPPAQGAAKGPQMARAALAQSQVQQSEAETQAPVSAAKTSLPSDRTPRPTLGAVRAGATPPAQSKRPQPAEAETAEEADAHVDNAGTPPSREEAAVGGTPGLEQGDTLPSREEAALAWGDVILAKLPNKARIRFQTGRFIANDSDSVVFALPNQINLERCLEIRSSVDQALAEHFNRPVPLRLTVDDDSIASPPNTPSTSAYASPSAPRAENPVEAVDSSGQIDEATAQRAISNLLEAFPGAELITVDASESTSRRR